MKLYIILTYDIHQIGGTQAYTWGKCETLINHGWETAVFFPGTQQNGVAIGFLERYCCGGMPFLYCDPTKGYRRIVEHSIEAMLASYNIRKEEYKEIIIESHFDSVSLWGELLAKRLNAKHMCMICNEDFNPPKLYKYHQDFFQYKLKREELYGISKESLKKLFAWSDTLVDDTKVFSAFTSCHVVEDVDNDAINYNDNMDFCIGYFGRCSKEYFDPIVKDVASFAKRNNSYKICLIFIGDTKSKVKFINETTKSIDNLFVIELGNLSPVPRSIFSHLDVIIAGAGCAWWASKEMKYVLIADAGNYKANGFLGFDTENTIYAERPDIQNSFTYYLEELLINGSYSNRKCKPIVLTDINPEQTMELNYQRHLSYITNSQIDCNHFQLMSHGKKNLKVSITITILSGKKGQYIFMLYRTIQKVIMWLKK